MDSDATPGAGKTRLLGKRKYTFGFGRSRDSIVDLLSYRGDVKGRKVAIDILRGLSDGDGLDFIRRWDQQLASFIVILLFMASMTFIQSTLLIRMHSGPGVLEKTIFS
jgi:hypothetical protein